MRSGPPSPTANTGAGPSPVSGFGDPAARIVVVGPAPAVHGGNRTGRMFTGDRSGDRLYGALHRAGLADRPSSTHRDDGPTLREAYVTAVVRCAPPANKPAPRERDNCLAAELRLLTRAAVIVCLGAFAWDGVLRALRRPGRAATPDRASVTARRRRSTPGDCWDAITPVGRTRSPAG